MCADSPLFVLFPPPLFHLKKNGWGNCLRCCFFKRIKQKKKQKQSSLSCLRYSEFERPLQSRHLLRQKRSFSVWREEFKKKFNIWKYPLKKNSFCRATLKKKIDMIRKSKKKRGKLTNNNPIELIWSVLVWQ